LKEGDLLSMLDYEWEDIYYKAVLNAWIQAGYEVIVPSRLVPYHYWHDIGFIARNPWKGSAAMLIFTTTYGGVTVVGIGDWPVETRFIFREGCLITEIIPDILAPSPDVVYHKGDTMGVTVQYDITYLCDTIYVRDTIIEDYSINTSSLSPDKHYLYAVGRLESGEEVKDSIPVWVVEFTLRENLVDRYFNPLKPDSGRVAYRLLPSEYADPDVSPSPISMKVEIRDKDSVLVYGARELSDEEKRNQVLYWNGMGNGGDTLNPERGPFEGELKLRYREVRGEEGVAKEEFSTNLISVAISNLEPSHKKIIAVRGDKLSFEYEIESSPIPIVKREVVIVDKDHHLNEPIFREELTEDEGTFEWDGKCNEDLWGSEYNKKGHYADPRLNPYRIGMNIEIEGEDRPYEFELVKDVEIVPEIVKVIGTHTPFAANASCDELNPLELTNICVIEGKVDDTGDESEDMLYYTEDEQSENVHFWDGRTFYENDDGVNQNGQPWNYHNPAYWIEMLNARELRPEYWNDEVLGNLNYTWTRTRGPVPINTQNWSWQNQHTFTAPGTYVFDISTRNYVVVDGIEHEIQDTISPPYYTEREYKVKSAPLRRSDFPEGAIGDNAKETIDDWYMIHIKGPQDDTYDWARSFLRVPYVHDEGVTGHLTPNSPLQALFPMDYHYNDCVGLVHAAEWMSGRQLRKVGAHWYIVSDEFGSNLGEKNQNSEVAGVGRNDWAGIDPKDYDMDGDGTIGEDPPWDINADGFPGIAGVDDDGDGLIDEDSYGRQPGDSNYTNDLREDDDEDGYRDAQGIHGLNEDPGDNRIDWPNYIWSHIILLKNYSWWNSNDYPQYKKTLGHKYDFIHACPNPGYVAEQDQFRYSIIYATGHETGTIYSIQFRRPTGSEQ
ncbi:hypothetical protein KAW48_01005, partial [candidate division WOR-3 bacterium]|nr:hypothetical protein [candidate division WOR-3 bacterium]